MEKHFAALERIDNDRPVTKEIDYEFWHAMEEGLLLALRDRGSLNGTQYRLAEESLHSRRMKRAKNLVGQGRGE